MKTFVSRLLLAGSMGIATKLVQKHVAFVKKVGLKRHAHKRIIAMIIHVAIWELATT